MRTAAVSLALLTTALQSPVFEAKGVCVIDESSVGCWDLQGTPDPGLTEEVRRQVGALAPPLSFVSGHKNRFVVVRHRPYATLSYGGGGARVQMLELDPQGSSGLAAFRVAAEPDARQASVSLTVGTDEGRPVEAPFREGAKATVGGVRIELGKAERNPLDPYGRVRGGSGPGPFILGRWRFPVQREETTPPGGFRFEALGRNGKPIRFVDQEGRPVADDKGEAYWKDLRTPGRGWMGPPAIEYAQFGLGFGGSEQAGPLFWVGSSIAPQAISRVRITRIVDRQETLGPFPLDPK